EEAGKQEKTEIVREHAEALASIHSITVDYGVGEFTDDGFQEYSDWKSFIQNRIESYELRASLEVEKKAVNWLRQNIDVIDREIEASVVHDDLHVWNTLKEENQSIGVLDAEQAFFGDKEYDLVKTMSRWTDDHDLSKEFLDAYQRHDRLEEGYEDRMKFYEVEIHLRGTINAREKVENGKDELKVFYENDKQALEKLLAE
ncbi:MAG: phosphotransferase family protein, partial [Candidatus Aenigmatarchaeota archaeon]